MLEAQVAGAEVAGAEVAGAEVAGAEVAGAAVVSVVVAREMGGAKTPAATRVEAVEGPMPSAAQVATIEG